MNSSLAFFSKENGKKGKNKLFFNATFACFWVILISLQKMSLHSDVFLGLALTILRCHISILFPTLLFRNVNLCHFNLVTWTPPWVRAHIYHWNSPGLIVTVFYSLIGWRWWTLWDLDQTVMIRKCNLNPIPKAQGAAKSVWASRFMFPKPFSIQGVQIACFKKGKMKSYKQSAFRQLLEEKEIHLP